MRPSLALGLGVTGLWLVLALGAPWLGLADPIAQDLDHRLEAPSAVHWFGTDTLGRDLGSRLIWGARASLATAMSIVLITVPVGLVVGLAAGLTGGAVETVLMRLTDAALALPRLVLALAFVATFGAGLVNGILALSLTAWPTYARQARLEAALLRNKDHLAASRMAGIGWGRIVLVHVLPLCLPSALVRAALDMAAMVLAAAGLGFLGLGIQPPVPEWGTLVAEGSRVIYDQWWVAAFPGLAILTASVGFLALGDGLRDRLGADRG